MSFKNTKRGKATRLLICAWGMLLACGSAYAAITYKQGNNAVPQTPQSSVTVTYASAQTAGSLNVIAVAWFDTTSSVVSVTDTRGNSYSRAVGPTAQAQAGSQSIYYAPNIAAGTNTVTVTFNASVPYPDVRIAEYSGVSTTSPLDVTSAGTGTSSVSNTSNVTTTNANDLIVGANYVTTYTESAGTGYTSRMITSPDGSILEDRVVTATGAYTASASLSSGGWIMQLAAFRAASTDTTPPTAPAGLTAAPASSTQISLGWTASTDNVGVTGYQVDRCQGSGCSTFTQIGTSPTASFASTGLTASTSYSYRVRATDAAGNVSANSSVASATTQATPDTTPPTAPSTPQAAVVSSTQINLSWTASTDNVGVTGYQIDRCQGSGCTTFAQIGTSTTTTFSSTGLAPSTTYRYQMRAIDAAGNVSANSTAVSSTTQAAPDSVAPTVPTGLSASAVNGTQINLSWVASTDNVGVTSYQIDRCQGPNCTTFAQIGTSSITILNDTGLTSATSYTYRVRAADAAGNVSANSAAATAVTFDTVAPSAPTGLNANPAIGPGGAQINLTWSASGDNVGVNGYQIDRCQNAGCAAFAQIGTSATNAFSDGLGGAPGGAGASYSYRVRAYDAAGNISANSGVVTTTGLVAPFSLNAFGLSSNGSTGTQITLTWKDSNNITASGETGVKIERCQGVGCNAFVQIAILDVTDPRFTFTDSGLSSGTTYAYRVRATSQGGDTQYSNVASAATAIANATGGTIQYWYDPFGNLIQTNAGGAITTIVNDLRGRKTTMADADLGAWAYAYDATGEMVRQTDAKGQVSTMAYDLLGRITQRSENGLTSKFFYDSYPTTQPEWDPSLAPDAGNDCSKGIGKLCYAWGDNDYRRVVGYDTAGRPSQTITHVDSAYKTTIQYDTFSRVSLVTYPDNFQVFKHYNTIGHLEYVTNNSTGAYLWKRTAGTVQISASGTVVTELLGSMQLPETRNYDNLDRLTSATSSGNAPLNLTLQYDTVGNVTQRADIYNGVTENFAYDSLNRLTSASGNNLITRSFDYDVLGNIAYKSDAGLYTYGRPAASCSGFAGPHAVTGVAGSVNASYCYDANGNTVSGAGRTLTYTGFNLPAQISQLAADNSFVNFAYTYDVDHQRARLGVDLLSGHYTTIYLHPAGGALFYEQETKPDGTVERRHFVYATGLVGVYVKDNEATPVDEMRYFHFDQIGSIVAVTNEAGAPIQKLAYEAYGKRRGTDGTPDPNNLIIGTATDRGFTGHEHLDDVGLIHMNGRVYDPLIGRFMTADPQIQDITNLQAFNRYSYVLNNPLGFTDPTGFSLRSRISHAFHSLVAFDPLYNTLIALRGIRDGNLAEAMEGFMHAASPTSIWVDRYVRNHPSLAPYYEMAMTTACSIESAGVGSMACAAGATAYVTGLMGGGNTDILKAGAISFATAYAMNEVGNFTGHQPGFLSVEHFENIAGHALVGCASTAASGGSCRSGAMSGGFGSLATPLTSGLGPFGLAATMVVGGAASELGGGKFANGAKTAAFGYLFNYLVDPTPSGGPPGPKEVAACDDCHVRTWGEAAADVGGVLGVGVVIVGVTVAGPEVVPVVAENFGTIVRTANTIHKIWDLFTNPLSQPAILTNPPPQPPPAIVRSVPTVPK
jgi:RHS repeat-associated protein